MIFFIDLESIQHKLSSDYSLNIYSEVGNMEFFFRNCTHILTRTQGKKFEDMFLIKVTSKGTSLSLVPI